MDWSKRVVLDETGGGSTFWWAVRTGSVDMLVSSMLLSGNELIDGRKLSGV